MMVGERFLSIFSLLLNSLCDQNLFSHLNYLTMLDGAIMSDNLV